MRGSHQEELFPFGVLVAETDQQIRAQFENVDEFFFLALAEGCFQLENTGTVHQNVKVAEPTVLWQRQELDFDAVSTVRIHKANQVAPALRKQHQIRHHCIVRDHNIAVCVQL